ncbi:hypothetical protein GWK47_031692 [Chionoecetes opilio]|uniref:Uncharacterized protein n=1 Tax=Chionoecetes opilio TaxID=41210 RepID=A0A8J4YKC2_CHIOP|nr:hypothetical protein GWK47_031692 [Chionoecetes opilio]
MALSEVNITPSLWPLSTRQASISNVCRSAWDRSLGDAPPCHLHGSYRTDSSPHPMDSKRPASWNVALTRLRSVTTTLKPPCIGCSFHARPVLPLECSSIPASGIPHSVSHRLGSSRNARTGGYLTVVPTQAWLQKQAYHTSESGGIIILTPSTSGPAAPVAPNKRPVADVLNSKWVSPLCCFEYPTSTGQLFTGQRKCFGSNPVFSSRLCRDPVTQACAFASCFQGAHSRCVRQADLQ